MTVNILERLAKSEFRSRFKLSGKDKKYVADKGLEVIKEHAKDFIKKRVAPSIIPNDGKQTPMRNHPVFVAQHATACCCRKCVEKWHGFKKGIELTEAQQEYLVEIIMEWIKKQCQDT